MIGGLFGGGGNPPPGTVVMTDNTTGLTQAQQMQRAYTASQGQGSHGLGSVLQKNSDLLNEIRDELKPLKEWLIATYPDIYEQYRAVETLRQIGREK